MYKKELITKNIDSTEKCILSSKKLTHSKQKSEHSSLTMWRELINTVEKEMFSQVLTNGSGISVSSFKPALIS